jgi:hypothetical protein
MTPKRWSSRQWRRAVWAVGTLLVLGYYGRKAIALPRSRPVGVERRLFARGLVELDLQESPAGGRWVVMPGEPEPKSVPAPGTPAFYLYWARRFYWPSERPSARRLRPFGASGTWWLGPGGLHRAWRIAADGWLDDHRLWSDGADYGAPPEWVLDVRTGRTQSGDTPISDELRYAQDEYDYRTGEEPSILGGPAGLEELPADFGDVAVTHEVGERSVELVYKTWAPGAHWGLYAISDHAAPRVLRLTGDATPLELSQDGRTLFYLRRNALWRLDFRRPLPELLDAVPVPDLPDPPGLHVAPPVEARSVPRP